MVKADVVRAKLACRALGPAQACLPTLMSTASKNERKNHLRLLLALTFVSRLITFAIVHLSSLLPLFDSSPRVVTHSKWANPHLRWDAFHFAHVAHTGYLYEYEWAFFPGTPFVMRVGALVLQLFNVPSLQTLSQWNGFLLGAAAAALACGSTRTLYELTLRHTGSSTVAFLASLLSLIPSSPATAHFTGYTEPFFTYLSYNGTF